MAICKHEKAKWLGNKNVLRKNKTFYTNTAITSIIINHNVVSESILVSRRNIAIGIKDIFGIYEKILEGYLLGIRWELKGSKYRVANVIPLLKIITAMHLPHHPLPPILKQFFSLSGSPNT